jgi:hypothetical protein
MFKNLALWLLVIFAGLTLFQVMNNQRNPTQEFSYTEFTKQLESGNVADVMVFDGKRLEGDFRTPVVQNERDHNSPHHGPPVGGHLRALGLPAASVAGRRQQSVLLRKVQGEAPHRRYAESDFRGCRGC